MKLSAPKVITWWVAVVLGVAAILLQLGIVKIAALSGYAFWIEALAFLVLAIATLLKKI